MTDQNRRGPDPVDPEAGDPEAGLVIEDDEIELSDEPETEADPAPQQAPEPEPEPEPEPIVIPAHAVSDDWHDEPPTDGVPVAAEKPRRRWRRYVLLAVLVLIGAAYVAGYFLTGTRMPADASIGGVDVSGKTPSAARKAVDAALSPNEDREIVLTHGKKEFTVKPSDAGLALDVERSVARVGGERSWDPRDMTGLLFGSHHEAPALDVDAAALKSAIDAIGESVNREVVEAQITFPDGKPKAREPKVGLLVPQDEAATAIRSAYLVDDEPIKVPTVDVEPTVDSEGLAAAMTSLAEPAVSAPITLVVGDKSVPLPVSAYAPALRIRVQDGALAPYLDPEKLAKPLTDSTTGIGKKAVDATIEIKDGKPVVIPGKEGIGLQPEEMATQLIPALTQTGDARSVTVEAKVVSPSFTTEDAKALGITEKIGDFTTYFPYAEYRNINQGRGAELIDGSIVKPGETFSFNDTVGERTEANGFTTGTVINGGVFREELGGGVSQVVTTMYNATFFGGMVDVEHHPHAFYIDRYPKGREATVYYGSLDLRWKNPTDHGVLVRAYIKKSTPSSRGEMHVELWSTKVWDKIEAGASAPRNGRTPGTQYDDTDRCVAQGPIAGFDIDIFRTFVRDGKVVKTETTTANYQAADRVICGKKPKPKDSDD